MSIPEGAQLSRAMVCQSCMPARQPDCQPAVGACRPALVYRHHSAVAFALRAWKKPWSYHERTITYSSEDDSFIVRTPYGRFVCRDQDAQEALVW